MGENAVKHFAPSNIHYFPVFAWGQVLELYMHLLITAQQPQMPVQNDIDQFLFK